MLQQAQLSGGAPAWGARAAPDGRSAVVAERRALALAPRIDPAEYTPRDLRPSFVSLLSEAGVPIEQISRLVGRSGTTVTELIYRHELRPVIQTGATAMDRLFGAAGDGG